MEALCYEQNEIENRLTQVFLDFDEHTWHLIAVLRLPMTRVIYDKYVLDIFTSKYLH